MAKKKASDKPKASSAPKDKGPTADEQPVLPRGGSGLDDVDDNLAPPIPPGTKIVKTDQESDIGAAKAGKGAVVDEDAKPKGKK
jgi:hypothetical protein